MILFSLIDDAIFFLANFVIDFYLLKILFFRNCVNFRIFVSFIILIFII